MQGVNSLFLTEVKITWLSLLSKGRRVARESVTATYSDAFVRKLRQLARRLWVFLPLEGSLVETLELN